MTKLFLGCTSLLAGVIVICTGFIVSALEDLRPGSGNFSYSLFDLNLWWVIIPLVLLAAGGGLSTPIKKMSTTSKRNKLVIP